MSMHELALLLEDEAANQQQSGINRHHPKWDQPAYQKVEEKLARWKRHFASVLNVHSIGAEEARAGSVDHSQMNEPDDEGSREGSG